MQPYHNDGVSNDNWNTFIKTVDTSPVLLCLCLDPTMIHQINKNQTFFSSSQNIQEDEEGGSEEESGQSEESKEDDETPDKPETTTTKTNSKNVEAEDSDEGEEEEEEEDAKPVQSAKQEKMASKFNKGKPVNAENRIRDSFFLPFQSSYFYLLLKLQYFLIRKIFFPFSSSSISNSFIHH